MKSANTKHKLTGFSRQYKTALKKCLKRSRAAKSQPANGLGLRAMAVGLETLDLAKIHEQALIKLILLGHSAHDRETMIRRAGLFFAETITPIEETHRIAQETNVHMERLNRTLLRRSADLAASNLKLKQQIAKRKSIEKSLMQSEEHYGRLLEQSRLMQQQLRLLSRQLLSAQEEERKKISRELHDVIAQTLTTINVRLSTLKKEATLNSTGLEKSIARTQKLIQQSVDIVHQFARELRPTVLDDLGLLPALRTFMKSFRKQTGIRVNLSAFAEVEQVNGDKRIVLYRVAQEAFTNVARHAQASQVDVKIKKMDGVICMKIKDNGKGFQQQRVLHDKKGKRLGLLGMKERLEMVNGAFTVTSAPGKGTTVLAQIPLMDRKSRGGR